MYNNHQNKAFQACVFFNMISYNELKPGTLFIKDGEPYKVLEYSFIRKQQRKPVTQLKVKNLISGKVQEFAAHQNDSFEEAEIEKEPAVFIYSKPGEYWFHEENNPKNRFSLSDEEVRNSAQYLKEKSEVKILKFSERIVGVELPVKMDFKVIEAPPAVKGATAAGGTKIVTIETGAKINTPLFVSTEDVIRINTETGEYDERVEKA